MKRKTVVSLVVIFAVLLSSAGIAYAVPSIEEGGSIFGESQRSSRFVLEDSWGYSWNLNIAFGSVLYGSVTTPTGTYPAYGFISSGEMVLWANGPGGGLADSFAYTGKWNFKTMIYNGTWINYPMGTSGYVDVWPMGTKSNEGIDVGNVPLTAKSRETANTQDVTSYPAGASSVDKADIEQDLQLPFGDLSDRGTICYEDSYGYNWDLNMAYGVILYGTVDVCGPWPALGFKFGDEMFLLEEGDCVYFNSQVEHHWKNNGPDEVVALWITTPPSF